MKYGKTRYEIQGILKYGNIRWLNTRLQQSRKNIAIFIRCVHDHIVSEDFDFFVYRRGLSDLSTRKVMLHVTIKQSGDLKKIS